MKAFGVSVAFVALMTGVGLVSYARWTHTIDEGDAALEAGHFEQALAAYESVEARFDKTPAARQVFARESARVTANRLWLLYRLTRYDAVVEVAQHAPAEASPHFWAGCALFEKARAEQQPEARLGWLARAEESFRQALDADPGDWDTKFDYELAARLVSELRKQPKTPPSQMMQLLRPPTAGAKVPRRVG